jgi:hypothetical protein
MPFTYPLSPLFWVRLKEKKTEQYVPSPSLSLSSSSASKGGGGKENYLEKKRKEGDKKREGGGQANGVDGKLA